uniref:Uncharacterized protein n=1 Tax=uncultured marine virus TaxID=186617 RepID=A0A0F7LAA3_9VIRU|nr:hypothetical protein [uncultured marine virus]
MAGQVGRRFSLSRFAVRHRCRVRPLWRPRPAKPRRELAESSRLVARFRVRLPGICPGHLSTADRTGRD